SSSREKRADEVERQVDDIYTVAYMRDFLGEEFNGVISGVTSFGIFVELENTAEVLVRLEDLPKGNYVFDEKTYTLFSNKNVFKLGDSVKIKVVNCDVLAGQLDFILVNR
ncbi:MAG TPA: ribonuclease R, partial [Clostridiales bacterium]|nr:ribonuclease R [Clostridiales bacterium]